MRNNNPSLANLSSLRETINKDYRCPKCGDYMSSGINEPSGDYDDWLIQPHCTSHQCEFVTDNNNRPFDECVPTVLVRECLVGYKLTPIDPRCGGDSSFHLSGPIPRGQRFSRKYHRHGGGAMYNRAKIERLNFSADRWWRETANEFYWRARRELDKFLGQDQL